MSDTPQKQWIPYAFAKKHQIVVDLAPEQTTGVAYYVGEINWVLFAEVQRVLSCDLLLEAVSVDEFQKHLSTLYQSQSSALDVAEGMQESLNLDFLTDQMPNTEDLLDPKDDAPIIRLLNALFTQAIKQKASDIHIETYAEQVLVRNRVDGVLQEVLTIPRGSAPLVISRVKVMAKLDIAEKRVPQDGRIALRIGGHNIDVRVSTLPSSHGERVVMRILDKQAVALDLATLGMPPELLKVTRQLIAEPHGILLVTGPTGSGKTTSLYAMLTELNQISRNILTIEDPIEYDLPGIGQTQVNSKVDMTFAKGLRAILRQDPDVVMVGEIRDLETAQIAVQASLTGHLVLSTLHTNSAIGAITRLRDMGVESFLIASSVVGFLAQRLVRKLCEHCKTPHLLRDDERLLLDQAGLHAEVEFIYEPLGCDACHHQGYWGRMGIYELIPIDEALRTMIHRNEDEQEMEMVLRSRVLSIRQDGFLRVLQGITSITEVLRVTST